MATLYGAELVLATQMVWVAGSGPYVGHFSFVHDSLGEVCRAYVSDIRGRKSHESETDYGVYISRSPLDRSGSLETAEHASGSELNAADSRSPRRQNASGLRAAGLLAADLTTDFTPGVSNVKDATTAISGVNPITGEDAGALERVLAGLFAIPVLGNIAKYFGKGGKLLWRLGAKLGIGKTLSGAWDSIARKLGRADGPLATPGGRTPPKSPSDAEVRWRRQAHDDRTRARADEIDQPLEPTNPKKSSHGHGHADHGYHTTAADQANRVETGKSPSGRITPKGKPASRFHSPEAELEALGRARRKLDADRPAKYDPATGEPSRIMYEVETKSPDGFGTRYVAKTAATGKKIKPYEAKADPTTLRRARVIFEYVPGKDDWNPVTYFPVP